MWKFFFFFLGMEERLFKIVLRLSEFISRDSSIAFLDETRYEKL